MSSGNWLFTFSIALLVYIISIVLLLEYIPAPLIVKDLNKSEIEVNDIANKYKNLNVSKKKLLKSYLAFLELPISDI
ncbi:MAG: hypothetical protein HFJ54_01365 [Clostridia bacterium]|nr:hypothetical protein [Clostridia bacterium]